MFKNDKIKILSLLIYLIPPSFILGILITEILVFCASIIFLYIILLEKEFTYFNSTYFKIFLIVYFFLIINSFFSKDMYLSLKVSLPYIRYGIISLAIWFALEKNKNFINEFKFFLIPTIGILVIDGFYQYIFGNNIIGYSTQSSRLSSFFFDEWILGSFIQKFFPLLVVILFFNSKNNKNIYFKLFFLISSYLIVFFSGERAAFFLLSFLIILILIPLFKINKKIFKIFYILIPIVFLLFFLSPVKERVFLLNSETNIKNSLITFYNNNYDPLFKTSLNIFYDHPIIGSGVKTYRVLCKEYYEIDPIKSCSTHPHNYYFQALAESGLIGFITLLIILLYLLTRYFHLIFLNKLKLKENFDQIIILSGLLVFLWPFSTTGSFFNNFISIIFFFNLGFFIRNINSKKL